MDRFSHNIVSTAQAGALWSGLPVFAGMAVVVTHTRYKRLAP
jgi:hypothetical protein